MRRAVVMGVAGGGKSSVGAALAAPRPRAAYQATPMALFGGPDRSRSAGGAA